jgi:outer membrane receptor for ferrienterochelin and colicins
MLLLDGPAADAQVPPADLRELSLEQLMDVEVVYAASKFEQKTREAPSSVSIVTAEEIRQFGYRNLGDILRSLRGFYVTSDRNYSYVGVRGFGRPGDYNSRILLLVDGHRVNDNIYDSISVGNDSLLDVDLIERLEVVRGPGSSIYGNNAFFAVVNVIIRKGRDLNGVEVSGTAGSFDSYAGRLTYGRSSENGVEALLSGTFFDSNGQNLYYPEFDSTATNHGVAEGADDERAYTLFSSASYRGFTLEAAHAFREKGIPTGSFGTVFNDPRNRTKDESTFVDLKYESRPLPSLSILASLHWDRYFYRGTYVYDYPPVTLNYDAVHGISWGADLAVTFTGLPGHAVVAGLELLDNLKQEQQNYDISPQYSYLDVVTNSNRWAVFLQDEFRPFKGVLLNAGVRYDHTTLGGKTSPRLALILSPTRTTTLKLIAGEAFRSPNEFELHYNGLGYKLNPALGPETLRSYEVVLEQFLGSSVSLSGSAFTYRIRNLISQETVEADLIQYQNADEIRSKGAEVALSAKWHRITVKGSYSFQDTRIASTDSPLSNSPRHMIKLRVAAPLLGPRSSAGLEALYVSPRLTLAGNETPGFVLTNLTLLSSPLLEGLAISGHIDNLFDKRYGDPGAGEHVQDVIPQDGRSFRVKLTYKF